MGGETISSSGSWGWSSRLSLLYLATPRKVHGPCVSPSPAPCFFSACSGFAWTHSPQLSGCLSHPSDTQADSAGSSLSLLHASSGQVFLVIWSSVPELHGSPLLLLSEYEPLSPMMILWLSPRAAMVLTCLCLCNTMRAVTIGALHFVVGGF